MTWTTAEPLSPQPSLGQSIQEEKKKKQDFPLHSSWPSLQRKAAFSVIHVEQRHFSPLKQGLFWEGPAPFDLTTQLQVLYEAKALAHGQIPQLSVHLQLSLLTVRDQTPGPHKQKHQHGQFIFSLIVQSKVGWDLWGLSTCRNQMSSLQIFLSQD